MLHQSPYSVEKCIARRRAVIQLQELVQLIRGDEAAVQHLAQQRIILCGTEGNRSFPVAHVSSPTFRTPAQAAQSTGDLSPVPARTCPTRFVSSRTQASTTWLPA